eukprot:7261181-Karenia_brevis.AAC.1
MDPKWVQNGSERVQNPSTRVKNPSKIGLGGDLGGVWGHLGPKSQQDSQKIVRPPFVPTLLGPKMQAKTHPKSVRSRSKNQ